MKCYILFLLFLSFSFISSQDKIQEIEYWEKIYSKYTKYFTYFSLKLNRKEGGVIAKYQRAIPKYEFDEETLEFIDITGDEGLKTYELTNEELGLKKNKELFKNFDKIKFPEETDFIQSSIFGIPEWHLNVDGKDYKANVKTDFYNEFNDLVNIKEIRDYIINRYNDENKENDENDENNENKEDDENNENNN